MRLLFISFHRNHSFHLIGPTVDGMKFYVSCFSLGKFVYKYKTESQKLIKLALPVLIASVAQTSMGFVDTVILVAIVQPIWLPLLLHQASGFRLFYLALVF